MLGRTSCQRAEFCMMSPCRGDSGQAVVELPDGARLRGRGLREGAPSEPGPEWGLYLLGKPPVETPWPGRWLRWPDFWLPLGAQKARSAFEEAHRLAADGLRVEVACGGGRGRTGTALACIAQLGGVTAQGATAWVREHYDPRAVETPWQRRYVRRFTGFRRRAFRDSLQAPALSQPVPNGPGASEC